ncbi:MAG: FAD-dependent oxidoreductase, partial [Pacificimonas sp.]
MTDVDVTIVGAGIAGAGLAFALAPHMTVALLEAEDQPGRHSTGRSAAFYAETYGGPGVQPLTTASRTFFETPPPGFCAVPLLSPRGALHVAAETNASAIDALADDFGATSLMTPIARDEIAAKMPLLSNDWCGDGLWEPGCRDIDVAALHQGYLRGARKAGVRFQSSAAFESAQRQSSGWRVETATGSLSTSILVNAAGAWADDVAET